MQHASSATPTVSLHGVPVPSHAFGFSALHRPRSPEPSEPERAPRPALTVVRAEPEHADRATAAA